MKLSTANFKSPDYTEEHEIFVGTHIGCLKKIVLSAENPYIQTNLESIANLSKNSKITSLEFSDDENSEILIGRANKIVQTYNTKLNNFSMNAEVDDGPIVGLAKYDTSLIVGMGTGKVQIFQNENHNLITSGNNMSNMRQCHTNKKLIATGGKENANNLKIYDIQTMENIFSSKNVPNDSYSLAVPVYDTDFNFLDESKLVTCSRYGYVRLYDIRKQRRPILNFTSKDEMCFTCLAAKGNFVYIGTNMGLIKAMDIRYLRNFIHTYKGCTGSVSDLYLDESGNYLSSASLDRYIRIHNANNCALLYQLYVITKANKIILRKSIKNESNPDEEDITIKSQEKLKNVTNEETLNDIFNYIECIMHTTTDDDEEDFASVPKRRKKKDKNINYRGLKIKDSI